MTRPPPREAGERVVLAVGSRDFNQRIARGAAAGWLGARRLSGLLPVMRRPRRVAEAFALMPRREVEQTCKGAGGSVDRGVAVAEFCEAPRHCCEREIAGIARIDFVPRKRRGDPGVRGRTDRIR